MLDRRNMSDLQKYLTERGRLQLWERKTSNAQRPSNVSNNWYFAIGLNQLYLEHGTKLRTSGAIPPFLYMLSWRGQGHYLPTSDRNLCEERWVAIQEWHWTVAGLLEITRTDRQTGSFYTVFSKTCRTGGLSYTAIPQQQQLARCRQHSTDKTVRNEIKRQKNSGQW